MGVNPDTYSDGDCIACPYCGHLHGRLDKHEIYSEDDTADIECENEDCEKEWILGVHYRVIYTGSKIS